MSCIGPVSIVKLPRDIPIVSYELYSHSLYGMSYLETYQLSIMSCISPVSIVEVT